MYCQNNAWVKSFVAKKPFAEVSMRLSNQKFIIDYLINRNMVFL